MGGGQCTNSRLGVSIARHDSLRSKKQPGEEHYVLSPFFKKPIAGPITILVVQESYCHQNTYAPSVC